MPFFSFLNYHHHRRRRHNHMPAININISILFDNHSRNDDGFMCACNRTIYEENGETILITFAMSFHSHFSAVLPFCVVKFLIQASERYSAALLNYVRNYKALLLALILSAFVYACSANKRCQIGSNYSNIQFMRLNLQFKCQKGYLED